MTTKGCIEYQFLVFGGLSILLIEVKYVLGNAEERVNAIAQVIALCDGTTFEFFSFNGSSTTLTFSQGIFQDSNSEALQGLSIASYTNTSKKTFISSLRPVCEAFFYILLLAYKTGIEAHCLHSAKNSEGCPQESLPGWKEAMELSGKALNLSLDAAAKACSCDHTADAISKQALEVLQKRSASQAFT